MSIPSFHVGTFQFPDTPGARRLADQYEIQSARRAAVHRTICFPPTVVQTVGFTSPRPNPNDPSIQRRLFNSPSEESSDVQPDRTVKIEFLEPDNPELSTSAYNAMAIQSVLTGTGQLIKHTSADVVNALMSTCDVPTLVADQKKNKAASVPGFISQLKKLSPEIMLPTDQKRHVLRSTVSTAVNEISREYKTSSFPVFTSQLIIALLLQTQNPQKIINQIHRFLGCADDNELQAFGDYCALGKAAPNEINFSIASSQLPGYRILMASPQEWMQLATFLLDYACFMNSSDLLQTYLDSKSRLSKLSLADFDSIQDFSDQEIACYNDHEIAAASSLRSVLDPVDRGNIILHSLSSELQDKINKRGRKDQIPENCKDRNWLIQALTKLETIKDPLLIKFKLSDVCKLFLRGKCPRGENCKYSHAAIEPPQPSSQNKPAAAPKPPSQLIQPAPARPHQAKIEDLSSPDVVDIQCRSMIADGCKNAFKASPSFWAGFTDKDGNPYSVPKSCDVCRKFKKDTEYIRPSSMVTADIPDPILADDANFSLVAAAETLDLADSGPHVNDGANDFYYGYDISMSDAQE